MWGLLQTWQKLQVSIDEKILSLSVVLKGGGEGKKLGREEGKREGTKQEGKEGRGGEGKEWDRKRKNLEGKGGKGGKKKGGRKKYRKEGRVGGKKGWERKERGVHLFWNMPPHAHTHWDEVMFVGPFLCRYTLSLADAH